MNSKKIINTDLAPKAIGAYSQAVEFNDFFFTSGQIPINPKTNQLISDDFDIQARQVLINIENLLQSEKLTFDNILKMTVYMIDLNDFDKLNTIFCEKFNDAFPARSVVQVVKLPKNVKIEIDAICHR